MPRFPNADAYQMLAYCTGFELPQGFLVYARDTQQRSRLHHIDNDRTQIKGAPSMSKGSLTICSSRSARWLRRLRSGRAPSRPRRTGQALGPGQDGAHRRVIDSVASATR